MVQMKEVRDVLVFVVVLSGLLLFAPAVWAQPPVATGIDAVHDQCLVNCFGREDQSQMLGCLIGCDNAAAERVGDEEVTLSSEDYVAQWGNGGVTAASACHSTAPCPAEYDSCASWSSYSNCGDPYCGIYRYCCADLGPTGPQPNIPNCELFGDALRQYRERYRVCFNASGQSCTEYQRTSVVAGCGCF